MSDYGSAAIGRKIQHTPKPLVCLSGTYLVKDGDTLTGIAVKLLGAKTAKAAMEDAQDLAVLNGIAIDAKLKVGQQINFRRNPIRFPIVPLNPSLEQRIREQTRTLPNV